MDKYIYINEYGEEEADMCTAIREMVEEGREEGREEGAINNMIENIRSLMNNIHFTAKEAMDALSIPENYRPIIMKRIDE